MHYTLENEHLKVTAKIQGAELTSIYNKSTQKEMLWNANPTFWARHAPVLFPIVGKLKEDNFTFKDNIYHLPQHGFARDMDFEWVEQTENSLVFVLKSTSETLKKYPFSFELYITYRISQKILQTEYTVRNLSALAMPFSIGAHPAFVCPTEQNESLSDYYLEFEHSETLDRHLLTDGLFNGQIERVMTDTAILDLNEDLFEKDAIVFKNMKSTYMILKSKKHSNTLTFSFKGFPYFGIWSKKESGFICLEPWCGLSDRFDFDKQLQQKEGIQSISPSQSFSRMFSVSF